MKIKNKLFFFILVLFSIVNIIDFITASFVKGGEANPIYILTNSLSFLLILKIVICSLCFILFFRTKWKSKFWLFNFIYTVCLGTFMISFGIYSNVLALVNNDVMQAAVQMSNEEKVKGYYNFILWLALIPYLISVAAFKVYEISEKSVVYEK